MNQDRNYRSRILLRACAGALLGVLLATTAWVLGTDRPGALASLGMFGLAAGPGFLLLGFALAIWIEGQGTLTWKRRLTALLLGMAAALSNLLVLMLLSTLFIGVYAILFALVLVVPLLLGGLGVGLGCQIECPCPRKEAS